MKELNKHIKDLKEGKDEAFVAIYNIFEKPLYNHLLKMLGNSSKAEEIFQESMLTLIKKIDLYSHRNDLQNSFKSWVFRIATNLAIDEIRKTKLTKITTPIEKIEIGFDSSEVEKADTSDRIQILIQKLPLMQKTFLNLKLNEDLSLKEIAVICKCEINTVKQGLFRARQSMKNLLIEEGIEL